MTISGPPKNNIEKISINDRYFEIGHLHSDLKGRTVRGVVLNVGSHSAKFLLHMVSTMVLARLLTPKDYGIFGMVTALTGFVGMFRDMGLSMATIQSPKIDQAQTSNLFWVNVGLSVIITAITALMAPMIARFYGEPRLTGITLGLAGGFVIGGLSVQHQALIRRQMRFMALAVIDISAMFISIVVGIVLGFYGGGYWALVCMQLALVMVTTVMSWTMCPWRPSFPRKNSGVLPMLSFGGNLTFSNILNYLSRNMDNILIGKYLGSFQLGLYSKAYNLLLMPLSQINTPITYAAIPALSRLQNNPERYRKFFFRAMTGIAYMTMPLVALMASLSDEIILIVLGSQWLGSSPIFQILAFTAIIQPITNISGWVFISLAQTHRMAMLGFILTPLYILSFAIGLRWDIIGVALSYTVLNCALCIPVLMYAYKYSPIVLSDVFIATWKPLLISIVLALVISAAKSYLCNVELLTRTAVSITAGISSFAVIIFIWSAARSDVYSLLELLKNKGDKIE